MDTNFDTLYDATLEASEQIKDFIAANHFQKCENNTALIVGDDLRFRAGVICWGDFDSYYKTIDADKMSVEAIKEATADVLAELKRRTRAGRIAELEAELARLKAEEEAE